MVNSYFIQCKLKTLLHNAVRDGEKNYSFTIEDFHFRHSNFNLRDGWVDDYWIIQKDTEANTYQEALVNFYTTLDDIVGKIEFIGQTYCGYPSLSPTLVWRRNYRDDLAFFRLVIQQKSSGLMFRDNQKEALDLLLLKENIPETFYRYWSAATKTKDYSAKLLVMLAAIESLTRKNGKLDLELRTEILGEELNAALFTKTTGLRHRLSHGEHISGEEHVGQDYFQQIHARIVEYFNKTVLQKELMSTNVVSPQRTDFESYRAGNTFVKSIDGSPVNNVNSIVDCLVGDTLPNEAPYQFDYSSDRTGY